jgi:hypothetical protein
VSDRRDGTKRFLLRPTSPGYSFLSGKGTNVIKLVCGMAALGTVATIVQPTLKKGDRQSIVSFNIKYDHYVLQIE